MSYLESPSLERLLKSERLKRELCCFIAALKTSSGREEKALFCSTSELWEEIKDLKPLLPDEILLVEAALSVLKRHFGLKEQNDV